MGLLIIKNVRGPAKYKSKRTCKIQYTECKRTCKIQNTKYKRTCNIQNVRGSARYKIQNVRGPAKYKIQIVRGPASQSETPVGWGHRAPPSFIVGCLDHQSDSCRDPPADCCPAKSCLDHPADVADIPAQLISLFVAIWQNLPSNILNQQLEYDETFGLFPVRKLFSDVSLPFFNRNYLF